MTYWYIHCLQTKAIPKDKNTPIISCGQIGIQMKWNSSLSIESRLTEFRREKWFNIGVNSAIRARYITPVNKPFDVCDLLWLNRWIGQVSVAQELLKSDWNWYHKVCWIRCVSSCLYTTFSRIFGIIHIMVTALWFPISDFCLSTVLFKYGFLLWLVSVPLVLSHL